MTNQTLAQKEALENARTRARKLQNQALELIATVATGNGFDIDPEAILARIRSVGEVTINFHPDRIARDGKPMAHSLLNEGVIKTQFETGISNGGLNQIMGGKRDLWEQHLWGDVYHTKAGHISERPKYGGLNLMNYSDGACPRFGSCHLRLKTHMLERCTYTFGDTNSQPEEIGVIDALEPVLACLIEAIDRDGAVLGKKDINLRGYLDELLNKENDRQHFDANRIGRALDDYIETQIHSRIDLAQDVESLVADPSFKDTETGHLLAECADKYGFELHWHAGFELEPNKIPDNFRNATTPVLAQSVGEQFSKDGSRINAAVIGQAAVEAVRHPEEWAKWEAGSDNALQQIKYLWHALVVFGEPQRATKP